MNVITGDVCDVLPLEGFDACFCDPPYGLKFMGKAWDHGVPSAEVWRKVYDSLKPGAPLLAFGGTRTHHRLMVAIEDAGFEIRDCLMWLYGSGFPKSHDISKGIDKADAVEERAARRYRFTAWVRSTGTTAKQIDKATGTFMGCHYTTHPSQPAVMTREHLEACRHLLGDVPKWVEREADIRTVESKTFAEREKVGEADKPMGHAFAGERYTDKQGSVVVDITAPATDAAQLWDGYGTALKPAWEPIVLAMKPCDGTFANNALTHGVAGLNVDGSRIGTEEIKSGRWPANVILDAEAGAEVDRQNHGGASRFYYCAKASRAEREAGCSGPEKQSQKWNEGGIKARREAAGQGKAKNHHPTVKPLDLCRYLATLIKPPKPGKLLVPFSGSGSEMIGAYMAGWRDVTGIELGDEYADIARARIAHHTAQQAMAL